MWLTHNGVEHGLLNIILIVFCNKTIRNIYENCFKDDKKSDIYSQGNAKIWWIVTMLIIFLKITMKPPEHY